MSIVKDEVALVTGAASGLGFEFSKLLASDGYQLVMVDIDESALSVAKQSITDKSNVPIDAIICDLSSPDAAEILYSITRGRNVNILINNAGFGLFGFFVKNDWAIEEKMIHLHVLTLSRLTKLYLKDMTARGNGMIMNVSSLAGFQPGPLMAVYYATKSYILSFSEAISNEVKGTGVTVTVFCPGVIRTSFQKSAAILSHTAEYSSSRMPHPAKVALQGYNAMKRGKTLEIPGTANKLLAQLYRVIPRRVAAAIVRRIQEKIRK